MTEDGPMLLREPGAVDSMADAMHACGHRRHAPAGGAAWGGPAAGPGRL
jgi:hypothetical protein